MKVTTLLSVLLTAFFAVSALALPTHDKLCAQISSSIEQLTAEIDYASEQAGRSSDSEVQAEWHKIVTEKRIEREVLEERYFRYECDSF